jgi:phosphoesterase RecJ-like protein
MKPPPKIVNRILDLLKESQTICVIGHVRPDGDCIGSQLAMTVALMNQGKKVYCWNQDRLPQKLAFMDPDHLMQKPQKGLKFDVVLAVDCASLERFGKLINFTKDRGVFINVDHHQSNTRYGDVNWIVSKAPSTGELVYRLIRAANWQVTVPIADCLFTAISTDTGSFQYPSTTPNTLHVAADLVNRGANLGRICEEVYQSFPLSRVRLLQRVLNHFRLTLDNQIGYFWLKPSDFSRTGCDASDSEGLIDHIRAIEPVQVAILFEEMETNLVRVSLRSKSPKINVNEIAGKFGGGGHTAAAGARIQGTPLSVQRRILTAVKNAFAKNA